MLLRRGAAVVDNIVAARPSTSTSTKCARCRLRAARSAPLSIHRLSLHTSPRSESAWAAAVQVTSALASNVFKQATDDGMSVDPLRTVAKEMDFLSGNVKKLLGSGHPSLDRIAKYYTESRGKHMRPLVVLLMSRATFSCPKISHPVPTPSMRTIDTSISPKSILDDSSPAGVPPAAGEPALPDTENVEILPSQRRLAEVTEMIHTASLLHDDVIDHSFSRRGSPSANLEFGNKMAVLAGDFLLGRASMSLARLQHFEVIELVSTVIANLVEGEFMQMKNTARDERKPKWSEEALSYYLQKSYLKTASLISKSCRAAALLGNSDTVTADAAYAYGRNLGLAFQLVDDMLDYTRSGVDLGKPTGADLRLGLATAPLLFAWKHIPELGDLVGRKFEQEGDAERARELVLQSDGIEETRALAREYSENAIAAIAGFPDSEAKQGLIDMAHKTINRQK